MPLFLLSYLLYPAWFFMPSKIKNKPKSMRFVVASVLVTGSHGMFCSNGREILVVLIVYGATLLNMGLLTHMVKGMFNPEGEAISKGRMVFVGVGKFFLLLGAITLGVHLVGNRVMIAVSNYVVQLFIVGIFLRYRYLK